MEFRRYTEEDYDAVCGFLVALNRVDRRHANWNWARFEWMYEHPEFDKTLKPSIGLWWDEERIVGAAIYDMYFGEAFCGVLPEYAGFYPEILEYAYREMQDDTGLAIGICDDCPEEIEAAVKMGFEKEEQTEVLMQLDLEELFQVRLPEGYHIKELNLYEEPRAFQWLLWQGFNHGDDEKEFEEDYEKTMQLGLEPRKHFDKRLSLAAIGPSGEYAAYCCLWYIPGTDYAYVEPVCALPGHRNKGVTKALLYEAVNRAGALGAKAAYVTSGQVFYHKLGFWKAHHYSFYRKGPDREK